MPHTAKPMPPDRGRGTYRPIKDYALIGNCGSAALISRDGSIDWLCWPRFDSPSVFGALLDQHKGGYFRIAPSGDCDVERRYVDQTNVLETTFRTEAGTLRVTDLMPVADFDVYNRAFWPDHEVLRKIECLDGELTVRVVCVLRPDYGSRKPRIEARGRLGYFCNDRGDVYVLRADFPLACEDDGELLWADLSLSKGDRRYVSLSYDSGEPAVLPLLGEHADGRIEQSLKYWTSWSSRCKYDGPYRDAVVRSALTLKLMTYSRSGAIVAAPTTSLPERIGGERNWDYRYCWLRDASLTLRALFELGYHDEGAAFFSWLSYSSWRTAPQLNVLYDIYGGTEIKERTLDHLEGYRGSRPVRVGNKAHTQLQLDTYGELVSAAFEYIRHVGSLDKWQMKLLEDVGKTVCRIWSEPDNGIWEIRTERRHHTYSKVMCWVALDRLLRLHESGHLEVPVEAFKENKRAIRDDVESHGYNERLNSYVAVYDGNEVDASLLLLPMYGYVEAGAERMRGTNKLVQRRLAEGSLMYRYRPELDDGLPPGESAFGICSFWDEEILARSGEVDKAKEHFVQMLSMANDVGLYGEEIDLETGDALGNFPQAFTHIGLINAALTIADGEGREAASPFEGDVVRKID